MTDEPNRGDVGNSGTVSGVTKIKQPHGGALNSGGKPGNKGGPGRPPSALRAKLREAAWRRIDVLRQIADDPKATQNDRMKAVDLMLKYGVGTTVTETDTEGKDAIRVIREPAAPMANRLAATNGHHRD